MIRFRLLLPLLPLLAAGACLRPTRLSSRCLLAPSQAEWSSTSADGRVEGTVADLAERTPIRNLELRLEGTERVIRTDSAGAFRFDSVAPGRYVLVTAGTVYRTLRDTLTVPSAAGLRGQVRLGTNRDVLTHCELYHP